MRSATESIIRAEELERLEDDMNIAAEDAIQMKPDFPALSAVDAMVRSMWNRFDVQISCKEHRVVDNSDF
jgi:hypothetical protein